MNTNRRSSSTLEKKSVGDPYKIYSEITNAGKNVQGTKKSVKWLFGFTELKQEIEVRVTHSLVTGKKSISENGSEVASSASLMATDFSHGWSSISTGRFFRIEINIRLGYDPEYIFSIDGVKFDDLNTKPLGAPVSHNTSFSGRYDKVETEPTVPRRVSIKPATEGNRSFIQSPSQQPQRTPSQVQMTQEFDPFAETSEPFDPFSNTSTTSNHPPAKATPPVRPPPAKVSSNASLFGTIDESTHSKASSAKAGSFDAFDDSTSSFASVPTTTTQSNGFAFDPFESQPTPAATNTTTTSTPATPDFFATTASPSAHTTSSNNLFDPFAAPVVPPPAAKVNPATTSTRRSSAADISLDFAGLSFAPTPEPPKMAAVPRDVPVVTEPVKTEETVLDPWASNLVDLNLSNKNAQRRPSSFNNGPSLNNLMGQPTQPAATRRASVNPQELLNSLNDPFGAPPLLSATIAATTGPASATYDHSRRMSSAQMISSLGPQGPPVQPFGVAGGPLPMGPGGGRSSFIMQQPPLPPSSSGMGASTVPNSMPMNGRASFVAMPPMQSSTQPKSSLDSLDWRSMSPQ